MFYWKKCIAIVLTLTIFALTACASQEPQVPVTGQTLIPGTAPLPPKVILDAQQWLAGQLSVAAEQVQIRDVEQAEWPDSCLGLGRPEESCAAVITPGWRAVFDVNGQSYEVRTNEDGSVIRLAAPGGTPVPETGLENTHWNLVSFGPAGAEQPVVAGSAITLMLAGGQAGGSGGCNSYGTTYRVDGNSISFGQVTGTLRACADSQATEQEQRYFQALESASAYEVQGDRLRITYDGGVMIFEKAVRAEPVPGVETPDS